MAKNKLPEHQRFLSNVPVRPTDGCWEWTGGFFTRDGKRTYGCFSANGGPDGAHRASYRLLKGPIPKGKCVLHSCDNPACVNPDHLSVGSKADNAADRDSKGRGVRPGHPDHPQTKMTSEMIRRVRSEALTLAEERGSRYGVLAILAAKYPVTQAHLSKVCAGVMDHLPRYKVAGLPYPSPNPHCRLCK